MNYAAYDPTRPLPPYLEDEARRIASDSFRVMREMEARFDADDRARLLVTRDPKERQYLENRIAWRSSDETKRGQMDRCVESARSSINRNA